MKGFLVRVAMAIAVVAGYVELLGVLASTMSKWVCCPQGVKIQQLNERGELIMAITVEQRYNEVEAECESVQDPFARLKAKQGGLHDRLISIWRAAFPGASRESSAWRALSAEYGSDEPITHAINSDVGSVRLQHYVDQYRR